MEQELSSLAVELFDIQALKFGDFVTKVGLKTPVYFDLRVIISYPELLHKLSKTLWKLNGNNKVDQLCGVPYTALPIATIISVDSKIPMLIKRKEAKSYGTKKLIEGNFKAGETCVIIEDVVTSGSSILETVKELQNEGLKVQQAFVVIDREQGGRTNLESHGIKMQNLFTLSSLMDLLRKAGKVNDETVNQVKNYIKSCQAPVVKNGPSSRLTMTFAERSLKATNPMASKLFDLMTQKKSTLCLAADLTKPDEVLKLADLAGPHLAVFKIHVDIIEDLQPTFFDSLRSLAVKHNFLIMEDRKFADIGNTVALQFSKGVFKIADWADLVTAHVIAGPGSVEGIRKLCDNKSKGIFLITEMSSKGTLTTGNYVSEAVSIGEKFKDLVVGHVCQSNVFSDSAFVQMTPGVKLQSSSDQLGQQYNTPEDVVRNGADLIVVGRGITEEEDQLNAVLNYKNVLWAMYEKRINGQL